MLETELNGCFAESGLVRPNKNRSNREFKRYDQDEPENNESYIVDIQIMDKYQ